MFHIEVVEQIETRISCAVTFSENCAIYEITSKNVVEPERVQMII
jgi:hypothetical protein